jgi:ornithine carrier protein
MQVQMLVAPQGGQKLPGPISVLTSVIRNGGLRGLWLGHTGTLIRETGGTAAWFTTKEFVGRLLVARRLKKEGQHSVALTSSGNVELRPWESALSGACAGAAFNFVLFPADTVKSAMQTEEELRPTKQVAGAKSPPKATFFGTFRAMYRAQGLRGLYAGCGITIARSIPSSAIIFLIYDGLSKHFG